MALPFLNRDTIVAVKVEPTPGTDSVPTVTNAILVYEAEMKPLGGASTYARKPMGTGLANLPSVPGVKGGTFTCKVLLTGSGPTAPTTAPFHDPFLKACGLKVVTSGGPPITTHTYSFTRPQTCVSIYMWKLRDNGAGGLTSKRYMLIGCMGDAEISMNNGEPGIATFTMTGKYKNPVDDAAPPAPTFTDPTPTAFLDANFAFQGFSPITDGLNLKFGNNVILRPSVNATDKTGYISAMITDRTPEFTWSMEEEADATFDAWLKWENATTGALNIGPIGATAGNKWQITGPRLTVDGPPDPGESSGLYKIGMKSILASDLSAADDEFALIYT